MFEWGPSGGPSCRPLGGYQTTKRHNGLPACPLSRTCSGMDRKQALRQQQLGDGGLRGNPASGLSKPFPHRLACRRNLCSFLAPMGADHAQDHGTSKPSLSNVVYMPLVGDNSPNVGHYHHSSLVAIARRSPTATWSVYFDPLNHCVGFFGFVALLFWAVSVFLLFLVC
jgi:hypothetical protein